MTLQKRQSITIINNAMRSYVKLSDSLQDIKLEN